MKRYGKEATPEQVWDIIQHADDHQISQIVRAVIKRFAETRPDEEVMFLVLPKNNAVECEQVITAVLDFLRSGGFFPDCAE